jgi:large subunit ribosomal protein L10
MLTQARDRVRRKGRSEVAGKAAKAEQVADLHAKFARATGVVLTEYRGLNVQQMAELRRRLRTAAVELQVAKNTLARRATEGTDFAQLTDYFAGPTSIAFTMGDVAAMAKALSEYGRGEPKFIIRVGVVEGKVISPQDVTTLADLPPRDVLMARLFASMQSPVAGMVGVLQGLLRQFLSVLHAIQEAKEKQPAS